MPRAMYSAHVLSRIRRDGFGNNWVGECCCITTLDVDEMLKITSSLIAGFRHCIGIIFLSVCK